MSWVKQLADSYQADLKQYMEYMSKYGKSYPNPLEFERRFTNWRERN